MVQLLLDYWKLLPQSYTIRFCDFLLISCQFPRLILPESKPEMANLPEHCRLSLALEPGDAGGQKTAELREDHRASTGPQGQTPPAPSPRTGHLSPRRDSLDSSSSTPGDHLGARLTHFGGLWRAGERGPLGSGPGPRSLSEQVEKNRLLLREMLRGGGAATLKPGPPSCDRAAPEPTPRPGQDRLPPPQARVKARMRPLRASHDIMPTLAPDRQAQGDPAGPSPPAAAPWDRSRRSGGRGGFAPGLGLKKIFSALGQAARPLAGRTRSHSVEQLRTPTPGPGTPEARRAPSLQFLHLVSRSPQRGKSPSFHSLQALLSGRGDRANLYRVQEPAGDSSAGRPHSTPPRRALSVEDVGAPSRARTVGRVVAAFPDGTSQLQLQCSPGGTFGFSVAAGSGRRDSGLYVRAMADVGTAKLYSGLLAVGDEILEVDGAKVAALGTAHVQELLARADSVSLRVLRQRPAPR
ncbi:uncharacterized protein KIAA1614 homolog [Sorex fumeus]|uniref:uncharacterized protein KIAA1614 homolog n=1 Tax=Sorex fumeus TaxID=62283 RepID=UPI0024AC83A5|nr:uncharacterized protein KIAA1614 homolog [Sorex fumeus]